MNLKSLKNHHFRGKSGLYLLATTFMLLSIVSPKSAYSETIHQDGVLLSVPEATKQSLSDKNVKELLYRNNIYTLEEYAAWIKKNSHYVKDLNGDDWADPETTLRKRSGDCEDFAFLNATVLKILGYEPKILAVTTNELTHAFTIVMKDNYYLVFDNNTVTETKARTFSQFIYAFMKNKDTRFIIELPSQNRNDARLLYKRS